MGEYLLPHNESQPINNWSTSDQQQQNYTSFDTMPIPGTSSNQNQQILPPTADQNSIIGNHSSAPLKSTKKASLKAGRQGGKSTHQIGKSNFGKRGENNSALVQGNTKLRSTFTPIAIPGQDA